WTWAADTLPKMGLSFDQMYHAPYGKWLIWAELGICGILPALLLVLPSLRNRAPLLYLGAFLTCAGVVLNRLVFTIQTLAMPVMPFDQWFTYFPHWTEMATCAMALAYGAIVVSLAYRYLPVFPQEKQLNY
ncbi:MAG: molybdopterin oxidoreductase, partial [Desulfohalobiaceae bacterium]